MSHPGFTDYDDNLGRFKSHEVEIEGRPAIYSAYNNLDKLRELRLWHWKQATSNRALEIKKTKFADEYAFNKKYYINAAQDNKRKADQHIKFVQTLNDFFPVDDTAEKDAMK